MTPHMNTPNKNETTAIRTQLAKSPFLEHSNPLYLTSSFVFEDAEDMRASFAEEKNRNIYSRFSNPNNTELVDKLCQLEGAEAGHTFATGMGAIFSSFAALLNSGDHVLSARAVFGSTHTLFTKIFPKWNIQTTYFTPEPTGHAYAVDLVKQIDAMNHGQYIDDSIENTATTDFCIGVAGYPEKHMEAPSLDSDLHFLKKKVEAGASYVVTQMFFDNQKYFSFVDKCRQAGIEVPIIPGLKPMATAKQLNLIPHRFHVDLPEPLIKEVIKYRDNKQVRQVGIEWCVDQSKELIDFGVPFLHYYSMGKSDNIHSIAKEVF